jgi:hypothetical protein
MKKKKAFFSVLSRALIANISIPIAHKKRRRK